MSGSPSRPFAAALQAANFKFVSISEAMEALTKRGDEPAGVAAVLRGFTELREFYLPKHGAPLTRIGPDVSAILYHICETGRVEEIDIGGETCSPSRFGWRRADLVSALCQHVPPILVNDRLELISPEETRQEDEHRATDWETYVRREWISLGEAATILTGFFPADTYRWGGDERLLINQRRNMLRKAIRRTVYGQPTGTIRSEDPIHELDWVNATRSCRRDCEEDQIKLSHADIREWCEKRGYHWPVPEPTSPPLSYEELQEELRKVTAERDELRYIKGDRDALRLAYRETTTGQSNLYMQSMGKIRALDEELGAAKQEAERLHERLAGSRHEIVRLEKTIIRNAMQATATQEKLENRVAQLLAATSTEYQPSQPSDSQIVTSTQTPPRPIWLMDAAIATQRRFWGENWIQADKDTWPTQDEVLDWLKQTYPAMSDKQRTAVEQVACPVNRDRSKRRHADLGGSRH